jgi:hypothetical protein
MQLVECFIFPRHKTRQNTWFWKTPSAEPTYFFYLQYGTDLEDSALPPYDLRYILGLGQRTRGEPETERRLVGIFKLYYFVPFSVIFLCSCRQCCGSGSGSSRSGTFWPGRSQSITRHQNLNIFVNLFFKGVQFVFEYRPYGTQFLGKLHT